MESVVEWSEIPRELVELISSHLPSESDLLRLRSVCSTWRSSVPPPESILSFPSRFPILPNHGISDTCWGFHLSKRTIFRLTRPGPDSRPGSTRPDSMGWVIKLERDNPARMHLLSPMSRSVFKPLPEGFPRKFDSGKVDVLEMAQEYTLQYINYRPLANSIGDAGNLYMEKVALSMDRPGAGFVLFTIHVSGKLVMYKSGDKKWTVIDDLPSPYDDVICKGGVFYAVDSTGRAVRVELDVGVCPGVSMVAESVHGGDKKFLVESCGDLLLVDMYLSGGGADDDFGYNEGFQFYEDFDCYMSERTVKFKVFKLDREMHRWEEMDSLGDRIVFLGDNSTFSALASELNSNCKGNCIFFTDQFYCGKEEEEGGIWKSRGIGVFDVESGSIGPIGDYPGYSDMFWPPPDWVYSTAAIETLVLMFDVSLFMRRNFLPVWATASSKLLSLEIGYISSVMVAELRSPVVATQQSLIHIRPSILPNLQKLCLAVDYITDTIIGTTSKSLSLQTHLDLQDSPIVEPSIAFDLKNAGLSADEFTWEAETSFFG